MVDNTIVRWLTFDQLIGSETITGIVYDDVIYTKGGNDKRANHNLDSSGYKTSIEATRPIDN